MRALTIILCLSLSMLLSLPASAQEGPSLTVTGEGQVTAVPDMATITLGVTERADTAADAMDAVSEAVSDIVARMRHFGIDARDMQTSDLSLNPLWRNSSSGPSRQMDGFEASNRLTVRVRDMDQLSTILQTAMEDGANRFSGLHFGMQNPRPLENRARRAAVADALAKAELYAEAAGVRLGPVRRMSEAGISGPIPGGMMMARAESMPVAAGETGISAQVTIVFDLEN